MVEQASAGGDSSSPARLKSSVVKVGDRTRFTVELRPGETTIVSWKKLMKDAAKADGGASSSAGADVGAVVADVPVPEASANAHTSLESRLVPGQPATNDLTDATAPSRFSAVIEKIERLYMGKDSSDDEDMGDIPDDDQYDTEDSFIDDEELDEYFEVDKVKTKHDGYFVNRGTLEKIEPLESARQQPKKRRRREMAKTLADNDNGHHPGKLMKVGKKGVGNNILPGSQGPSVQSSEETIIQSQVNASGPHHPNKAGDGKLVLDLPQSLGASNGEASSSLVDSSEKQKTDLLPAKTSSSKMKENNPESEGVMQQKNKSGMRERIDLNLPDSKQTMQHAKKPKSSLLEKAIRELERMVAESRPPALDAQNADGSSQSIKRRLPREIKMKLGKVARLSHASNGNVSKEVLNRLMGIVGHVIQMRTLKRHLKNQISTSLSAKQEKDDKFQRTKKEVIEMVKERLPSIMSKAAELQSGGSGEPQEPGYSDKALKGKIYMDTTLEDKICDLYDIFVDGLDEDAAPQIRKLYAELAELWPKGVMDNHGIKRAICRAKERKRTLNEMNKEKEKIRRKKLATPKLEATARVESSSTAQPQLVELRLGTSDPSIPVISQSNNKFISNNTPHSAIGSTPAPTSVAALPAPNFDPSKQEKVKGIHRSSLTEVRNVDGVVVKKKVKRRIENPVEGHFRPEKFSSLHSDERLKQNKHSSAPPLQTTPYNSSYSEFRFEPLT